MSKYLTLLFLLFSGLLSAQQTVGLFTNNPGELDGYVLFSPVRSDSTFLIDKCGKQVHLWTSTHRPGLGAFLLPNGNLLRPASVLNPTFNGNGSGGGLIEEYDWNNNLIWSYLISSTQEMQNHDVYPMSNGNVLVCVWEKIDTAFAIAQGRNPALLGANLWSAKVVELQPVGANSANIVWQWRLFDHIVQDFDASKPNYGVIADHPELLNLNYTNANPTNADWLHLNHVSYNESLDQIIVSCHSLSEIWIVDHSTTTLEAATHNGGAHGKGGDFLYRWGNPAAYNRGTNANQQLYTQHDPNWIPAGFKDGNKIMIFNNGVNRPGGNSASIDIIDPPIDSNGNYTIATGQPYGPVAASWSYSAPVPTSFFTPAMGGAQRLSNGNTMICEAFKGNFFEIDSMKNTVWHYVNPVGATGPVSQGTVTATLGVYRCPFYPPSYNAFAGRTLLPGNPIELNPLPSTCTMATGIYPVKFPAEADWSAQINEDGNLIIHSLKDRHEQSIEIFDAMGRIVENIPSANLLMGQNTVEMNRHLQSGIYVMWMSGAGYSAVKLVVP